MWSLGPAEVSMSALCSLSQRRTCLPSWRPPRTCVWAPVVSGVSPDDPGCPCWGQMGQRNSLPAPPERETPQEPRSQAILPAHSEIPEALRVWRTRLPNLSLASSVCLLETPVSAQEG